MNSFRNTIKPTLKPNLHQAETFNTIPKQERNQVHRTGKKTIQTGKHISRIMHILIKKALPHKVSFAVIKRDQSCFNNSLTVIPIQIQHHNFFAVKAIFAKSIYQYVKVFPHTYPHQVSLLLMCLLHSAHNPILVPLQPSGIPAPCSSLNRQERETQECEKVGGNIVTPFCRLNFAVSFAFVYQRRRF